MKGLKRKWLSGTVALLMVLSMAFAFGKSMNAWSEAENERACELFEQGYSMEEISQILQEEFGYRVVDPNASSNTQNSNSTSTTSTPAHTHTWNTTITKEATCTEQGEQTSTCSGCGETKVKATPKAEHTYTVASIPGTCIEVSKEVYTCAVCGDSYTKEGKKGEHDYQLTNAEPGTCQTPDKRIYTCSVCGDSYVEEGEMGNHDYQLTSESEHDVCTESGKAVYTCSVCGDSYTETVEPLGHELKTTRTVLQEATCTEDGKKAYVCTRCNAEIDPEVITATGHNPKYEVVKEAGLFTKGAAHTICTTCGEILSEEVLPSAVPFWAVCVGGIVVIAIVGVILFIMTRKKKL